MKVLYVVSSMDPKLGGVAQALRNYLPYWHKSGVLCNVVTVDNPNAKFVKQDNIIALGSSDNVWAYSKNLYKWFLQNIGTYDVVIVNGLWLYNNYALHRTFVKLKKGGHQIPKLFVMPHGMLDPYFQQIKGRHLKAIRNIFYWHLIEKKLINSADGLLFTCEEEMRLAKTTFTGYYPKKTYNVGLGILPAPNFHNQFIEAFKAACPLINDRKYLLFLSRIHPKKGIDLLLDAYESIGKNNLLQLPTLVIAGPGFESTFGRGLLNRINNSKLLKENIVHTNMLVDDKKWGAFYGCDAFILPSHQENFGIVVAEAMSCGKPVLITNKVNIWSEIASYQAGFVEPDTLEGIKTLLLKWINVDISEKEQMKNNALNAFNTLYSIRENAKKLVTILEN